MKKTLISLSALMIALPVMAANDCAYSPLQNLIRNVRTADQVAALMNDGVQFSEKVRCGGSLMQLAVLRGNADVLDVLLKQDAERANEMADLSAYPIPGAPREIPLILFASYYAPNAEMIMKLVNKGADIKKTDEYGRNLLWYMDQNPVLRSTELYDQLNQALLSGLARAQTKPTGMQFGNQMQPKVTGPVTEQPTGGKKEAKPSVVEATD